MPRVRRTALALGSILALAACGGADEPGPAGASATTSASTATGAGGAGGAATTTTGTTTTGAGGATTGTTTTGAGGAGGTTTTTTTTVPTEDPFDAPPAPPPLDAAAAGALAQDVGAALDGANAACSALVVGLDSGQVLFERKPDTPRTPASNTKLFTTASALLFEGEAGRPIVGLYGAKPAGGVIAGDVTLVAEHDPSPTPWLGDDARQALDAIAEALADAGVTTIQGGVVAKGEYVHEGNSVGTYDAAGERTEVAGALKSALKAAGVTVVGGASTGKGFDAPAGAALLVDAPSGSMDVIAHAINVPSHNEIADLLMHHLGRVNGGQSTYADGFVTVKAMLDDLGVARDGLVLEDGSGLSHANLVKPRQIVDLFRAMEGRPEWSAWLGSMAVAGLRGTIASRMTGKDTAGRFWGKTGTLTGVVALSGVLFHRHDGQRYLASFLCNGVASSQTARAAVDAAVAAIGEDRRGGGGLPAAPRLARVTDDGNGQTASIAFDEVPGATGYLVWRSADGRTWKREDARLVKKGAHRTVAMDGALFVRVTALGPAGEGPASSVLATRLGDGKATPALFVDGNDRYAAGPVPENPVGWGHDAVVAHAAAIVGPFESVSHLEVESGDVPLAGRPSVVWALGRESTASRTFSVGEQEAVRAYAKGAGRLFVSGAEIAWDLVEKGSAEDAAFAREVLGVDYVADDAKTTFVKPGDLPIDLALARFSKRGRHEVEYADVIAPAAGGAVCLRYAAGVAGAACVRTATPGGGRVVTMGLPLESLDDPKVGAKLVALP